MATPLAPITDRFGTAINQLGSDNLDVRLGGVYGMAGNAAATGGGQPVCVPPATNGYSRHDRMVVMAAVRVER